MNEIGVIASTLVRTLITNYQYCNSSWIGASGPGVKLVYIPTREPASCALLAEVMDGCQPCRRRRSWVGPHYDAVYHIACMGNQGMATGTPCILGGDPS